jgi:ribosomal protein S18 acetylase RimI-like enzyme
MIEVKLIETKETYPLRIEILRNGIAHDFQFVGDNDVNTFHIGAFAGEVCIGIATCIKKEHDKIEDKEAYQLRGMAVKTDIQNSGIGKLIVDKTIEILHERNCKTVWCNAREKALGFYDKMRFIRVGERFQIPKVGTHYLMYKLIDGNSVYI